MQLFSINRLAVAATTLLLPLTCTAADQLNWDDYTSSTYNSGNGYSNSYIVDGMMVNVTVGGTTSALTTTTNGGTTQSPAVTQDFTGGLNPVENSLILATNFANNTDSISVTVSFKNLAGTAPLPVLGVNFILFDVDLSTSPGYVDQVRGLQGVSDTGTTVYPGSVLGTSGGNVVAGSGAGLTVTGTSQIANTGAGSNGGNVSIDFGSQAISSFTFLYGNDASAPADPIRQVIALHDITFSVPEPGTTTALAMAGLAAGAVGFRRRRQHLAARR